MESAASRLQKEAKGYLDSLRGDTSPDRRPGDLCVDILSSNDSLTNADSGDNRRFLR